MSDTPIYEFDGASERDALYLTSHLGNNSIVVTRLFPDDRGGVEPCRYLAEEEWQTVIDLIVAAPRLRAFAEQVAKFRKDGEPDDDGEPWDMPNDDAVDTLHGLITEARQITGKED